MKASSRVRVLAKVIGQMPLTWVGTANSLDLMLMFFAEERMPPHTPSEKLDAYAASGVTGPGSFVYGH